MVVAKWTDKAFFQNTVNFVFGSLGDKVPQDFIEDRTRMRGAPFDVKAMAAACRTIATSSAPMWP